MSISHENDPFWQTTKYMCCITNSYTLHKLLTIRFRGNGRNYMYVRLQDYMYTFSHLYSNGINFTNTCIPRCYHKRVQSWLQNLASCQWVQRFSVTYTYRHSLPECCTAENLPFFMIFESSNCNIRTDSCQIWCPCRCVL